MKETIAYQLKMGHYDYYDYIFHEVTEEILREFFCNPNVDEAFHGSVGLWFMEEEDYIVDVCLTKEEGKYKLLVTDNEGATETYTLYPVKVIGG